MSKTFTKKCFWSCTGGCAPSPVSARSPRGSTRFVSASLPAIAAKAHFRREELVPDWSEMDSLSSPTPSPERQLVTSRQAKQLERILDAMPLEYRVVFVMFEIEGMTSEQIAESVGAPLGTVYSRLYRARKRFARSLARLGPDKMENKS